MSLAEPTSMLEKPTTPTTPCVYRIDLMPLTLKDAEFTHIGGFEPMLTTPVYWFRSEQPLDTSLLQRIGDELLVDPILERAVLSHPAITTIPTPDTAATWLLERQFLPGVTDNLGKTVEKSLGYLLGTTTHEIQVASGQVFWLPSAEQDADSLLKQLEYKLFNPLVQRLTALPVSQSHSPERYRFPVVLNSTIPDPEVISLDIADEDLLKLSQSRSLALTLDEMKTIRSYYDKPEVQAQRKQKGLPRWPTDVELEIFAQTWSEHCKHKIFAAKIDYTDASDPDFLQHQTIDGLFKTYIAGSTKKLMVKRPDLLSVFKDNAGVLRWNDDWSICFKVETHNSPSALEPYGGALTGIVGVNRDILGTGLGAKPIFNTDVFCFAHPEFPHIKRPSMLPPESILQGVRKGVEDGGNKSGIPTINGALFFDSRYRAKPLVFCGTGGLMPRTVNGQEGHGKFTQPGDTIVMAGGRVGKDGIHGATFSSEALHQDSPVSAVQIGDPITQKRMLDFQLEARDRGLLTGLTDNGAGGLSSSVGEMAELTNGARLRLEDVPLKYPGLKPYEIIISESQERMTYSTKQYDALKALADEYDVEISAIGEFHSEGTLDIEYHGKTVASLSLDFLHHGLPQMELKAVWHNPRTRSILSRSPKVGSKLLLKLLQHPNVCSREALIRQYDHEVQGRSVIKPLMGPHQSAPCDAAVIQPVLGEPEGLVVSNGLCPQYSDWDAYAMACTAIDEAVRNAVAVGADPRSIALLDNFCWPDPLPSKRNPDAPFILAQLVRANQALHDMAMAYETPFISGKDSMKNDYDDGTYRLSIPPTLLISAIGRIPDIQKAVSMEFKTPGDVIYLIGRTNVHMGGSIYYNLMGWYGAYCPRVETGTARRTYHTMFDCMQQGWIRSCHDLSEGGLGIALAESVLGGHYGASISLHNIIDTSPELRWDEAMFSETPSRLLFSVRPEHAEALEKAFEHLPLQKLGVVTEDPALTVINHLDQTVVSVTHEALSTAWRRSPASCYAPREELS